jgi:L-lactate utilization protein LutC
MPAKKAAKKTAKKVAKKAVKKTASKVAKKTAKKAAKKAAKAPVSKKPDPTFEEIATAAFLKHLKRRAEGLPDDPTADWLEAERELRGQ